MKKIVYNGITYSYQIYDDETYIFLGTEPKNYRKWCLFGQKLTKEVPKFIFKIIQNIENPCYTKSNIRKFFEDKIKIEDRKKEIKIGEIV